MCDLLEQELDQRVGGHQNRKKYENLNTLKGIHDFFLAYYNFTLAGCCCFKNYDSNAIEIKRVFVKKEFRNKGIAKHMLNNITDIALSQNYKALILETGIPLREAMELYISLGFFIIPNYGPYKELKYSICMKKELEKKI